jgi:hypothetical protein
MPKGDAANCTESKGGRAPTTENDLSKVEDVDSLATVSSDSR